MNIWLGSTDKRRNSTRQIDLNDFDQLLVGTLKDPTSILNPVLTISAGSDILSYNYVYIPDFERYYFIDEITSLHNDLWALTCSEDVLGTYRDQIYSMNLYVLRCSSRFDGLISDDYIASGRVATLMGQVGQTTSYTINSNFSGGCYVVGTVGQTSGGANGQRLYVMTPEHFRSMINGLMAIGGDGSIWGSLSQGVVNSIFNPMDYISSCYWLPLALGDAGDTRFYAGRWDSGVDCGVLDNISNIVVSYSAGIPKHPQIGGNYGKYLNFEPWAEYTLDLGFYQAFKLDSRLLQDETNISITLRIDPSTGMADVIGTTHNGVAEVFHIKCQYGVPVNISGSKNNLLSTVGEIVGLGASALTGNVGGTVSSMLNIGMSGIEALAGGTVSNGGGSGSLCGHMTPKGLYARFLYQVAKAPDLDGLPLRQNVNIGSLSKGSYFRTSPQELALAGALKSESDLIASYLSGGAYWE